MTSNRNKNHEQKNKKRPRQNKNIFHTIIIKIKNTTKKRIKDVNIKTKITINKIAKAEINQMILVI